MAEILPDHMDRWSRNLRLYETLKGMGLYVSPIPEPDDPTKIREMIVAADLPAADPVQTAEHSSEGGVHLAVERSKVRDVVAAAEAAGSNVVDFPSVL